MYRARLFLCLLVLGLTAAPLAAANTTAPGNAVAALEAREAAAKQREVAAERREADLARREAVREARSELADAGHSRLEVIGGVLGALIGLLGVAVTIATLIVTFRTPAVAAQAARETAHKAVADDKAKIEKLVEQAEALMERAKVTDAQLSALLDRHKAGQPVDRPDERATIEAAAEAARAKPPNARTIDDLRALIVASRGAGDWAAMRDHARALLYLHGQDRDAERTAYFNLAFALDELQRYEDALAALDKLIASYPDDSDEGDQELLAMGMYNRGVGLGSLDRLDEAMVAYDKVIRRFGQRNELALCRQVARAMVNKGAALIKLGESAQAFPICDEVVDRFGESHDLALLESASIAIFNKGLGLSKIGRYEEAIATYDELIRRFGSSEADALREEVAKAMVNKGAALGTLERHDDAIIVYDEVIRRFGDSNSPALREQVAMAMVSKGATGDRAEAIAINDEAIRRFSDGDTATLREQVTIAMANKAIDLHALGRIDEAAPIYEALIQRLDDHDEHLPPEQVDNVLFNLACLYALAQKTEATIDALRRWSAYRGEFDCERVAGDDDFDAVRENPQFVAFLREMGCVSPPSKRPRRRKPS